MRLVFASDVTVSLATGGAHATDECRLAIAGTGQLDLTDNDLVVQGTAVTKAAVLADVAAKPLADMAQRLHWLGERASHPNCNDKPSHGASICSTRIPGQNIC